MSWEMVRVVAGTVICKCHCYYFIGRRRRGISVWGEAILEGRTDRVCFRDDNVLRRQPIMSLVEMPL